LCFGATALWCPADLIWSMSAQSPIAASLAIGPDPHLSLTLYASER
jgi:hypothetical protein